MMNTMEAVVMRFPTNRSVSVNFNGGYSDGVIYSAILWKSYWQSLLPKRWKELEVRTVCIKYLVGSSRNRYIFRIEKRSELCYTSWE